jgi:hypothetical protein
MTDENSAGCVETNQRFFSGTTRQRLNRYEAFEVDAACPLASALPMNPVKATLTSPRPSGFPSPPRFGFPIRDVRFAHRGPLPCEGSGEGGEITVRGFKARNSFRRILSPCGGEGESQPVIVTIAKMNSSPAQQGQERNHNDSGVTSSKLGQFMRGGFPFGDNG